MIKTCTHCRESFEFSSDDRGLLDKMSYVFVNETFNLPDSELCPHCAFKRRALFRYNGSFHRRKSDLSGKEVISMYAPSKKVVVYSVEEWWSDAWDGRDYGRDFDFTRPFFEQFKALCQVVPRMTLVQDGTSENSDYTNYGSGNKNCYFTASLNSRDSYYSECFVCNDTVDSFHVTQCEKIYECLDCVNCYDSKYLQNCRQCTDSAFLENCISCKHCVGCKNLVNKEYHIFNEPYSKQEYEKKLAELNLDSY